MESAHPANAVDASGVSAARVLVVEDDDAVRAVVVAALTGEGYRTLSASDGAAALALLAARGEPGAGAGRRRPIDLILLDLHLPRVDGPAFVARYRRTPGPHAPVLVFAATGAAEAATHAERLGAAGFVTKPFDLDTLLAVVAHALQAPGAATEVELGTPPVEPQS